MTYVLLELSEKIECYISVLDVCGLLLSYFLTSFLTFFPFLSFPFFLSFKQMSSIPNSLIAEAILKLNAGEKLTDDQVAALSAFIQTVIPVIPEAVIAAIPEAAIAIPAIAIPAIPIPEAVAEAKAKKPRKAKTVKNDILMPVDMVVSDDPLRTHSSRLAIVDATLCQGRRIDEKNPIVGTRKDDDGANGMFYPEKQCTKKPLPGQKLCAICAKKDEASKTTTVVDKTWYGRLDEPLFHNAKVVGCKHFFEKYPTGLKSDLTTTTTTTAAVIPATVVVTATVIVPAKTKAKAKAKVAVEAVAVTSVAPIEVEWITFLHEGKPHIRNTKNSKVYLCDMTKATREESVVSDNFVGRWADGALNKFAAEDDE